ncbi:hypothetical protein QE152_g39891 [Popillia japonica]|uniref:Transposase n=1 Tax=Popillia japonica TaxID=7064 RepID=A0AAW1HSS0_POPJA
MDLDELDLKNDVDEVPADIQEAANRATLDLLPSKSRQQYDIAYNRFMEWCKLKKVEGKFSEIHSNLSDWPREFFAGKLENLKTMKLGKTGVAYESSEKAPSASFEISQLIAKPKKPHTINETLVKPCLIKAVQQVLGVQASKKIQDIPLSNNTVKARIDTMSNDIEDQLVNDNKSILFYSILISQELETTSKGKDVMKIICDYFERHGIEWKRLAGFCTDGAPAMLGSRSGLATLVKEKNPSTNELHNSSPSIGIKNTARRLVEYNEIGHKDALDSEYKTLLFHTEVRWLSKGSMLARLYELREELKVFFIEMKMQHFLEQSSEPTFVMQLAYLVDIFGHLNQLNLQLQGSGNEKFEGVGNIFVFEDKLRAFLCKIDLWIAKVEEKNFQSFATLRLYELREELKVFFIEMKMQHFLEQSSEPTFVMQLAYLVDIFGHLNQLNLQLQGSGNEKLEGVGNIFVFEDKLRAFLCKIDLWIAKVEEKNFQSFATLKSLAQNDSNFKDSFESGVSLQELWCRKAISYPNIREAALRYLMVFSTTFLCEQGFSTLLLIKNKQRNWLGTSSDLRLALSKILTPRIPQLVKGIRAQKSHSDCTLINSHNK